MVAVVDGQGGGLGALLVETIKKRYPELEVVAVGTNALATARMLKAGADSGATGENSVVVVADRADAILGPMAIVLADAMLGEITDKMAAAVARARGEKILVPASKSCGVLLAGMSEMPLPRAAEAAADELARALGL
jgi:hypothetical protein